MANVVIGTATVNVKADTTNFRSAIGGMSSSFMGMVGKIGGIVAGLGLARYAKDAIDFGMTYRVQMDNAAAAVHGLVEDQGDANKLIQDMVDFAKATPFDLPGIQEAATRMLAYGDSFGVTSDNVLDWVQVVGDAAASVGKGPDAMLNVITTMGKISGQGRIMTRDMNQLTANFPSLHPWELLAEMTGKTEAELRKLATKPGGLSGIVDTTEFITRLKEQMQEMPGAAGAMERRMQTLGGTIELFKDSIGVALADGLKPLFKGLQDIMKAAAAGGLDSLISSFSALASAVMTGLAPALPLIVEGIKAILDAALPVAPAIGQLAGVFGELLSAAAPIIGILADAIMQLLPGFLGLVEALKPLIGLIGQALLGALTALMPLVEPLIPLLTQVAGVLMDSLGLILPTIIDALVQLGFALQPVIDQLAEHFMAVLVALVPLLPPLAELLLAIVEALIPLIPVLVDVSALFNSLLVPALQMIVPVIILVVDILTFLVDKLGWVIEKVAAFVDSIVGWFQRLLDGVLGWIVNLVNGITEWFQKLFDKIVGHSIVPDLVNGIIAWFGKLTAPIEAVFDAILAVATTIWDGIKLAITNPIEAAKTLVENYVNLIKTALSFAGLLGTVQGVWNSIESAIVNPMQAAYDKVSGIVGKIKSAVQGAIDKVSSIPGAGIIGKIPGLAAGGFIDSPTLAVLGERSRREVVIPLSHPGRAMQLMQQSGLDRLAAQVGQTRSLSGPLVSMPGAVIQDATDADLVAQRTLVALTAAMAA